DDVPAERRDLLGIDQVIGALERHDHIFILRNIPVHQQLGYGFRHLRIGRAVRHDAPIRTDQERVPVAAQLERVQIAYELILTERDFDDQSSSFKREARDLRLYEMAEEAHLFKAEIADSSWVKLPYRGK